MSLSERQNEILQLLRENTYMGVNALSRLTYTSASSIRRDLAQLEHLGLVTRSYGGASLPELNGKVAGFYNRTTKNLREKRLIAQKAAARLADGQSILLDSSTTAGFLLPYIARLDGATLFTNNLETAISAIKQGICTYCLGGASIGGSVALGGAQTYRALSSISVDILFFSSQCIDADGVISDSTEEENFARSIMLERARERVFLCDSTKFGTRALYTLTTLDRIECAVFDAPYEGLSTSASLL